MTESARKITHQQRCRQKMLKCKMAAQTQLRKQPELLKNKLKIS